MSVACVKIRGQLCEISSLIPPLLKFWGLNSSSQSCKCLYWLTYFSSSKYLKYLPSPQAFLYATGDNFLVYISLSSFGHYS